MAATADKISEQQKKAISKNWTYIQENFDAKEILPHLIGGLFMKPSDQERIIAYNPNTAHNRNCAFFSWLFDDSPRGAYDAFMSALHNHGWKFVEEKIRNTDVDDNDVIIDPMMEFYGIANVRLTKAPENVQIGNDNVMNVYTMKGSDSSEKLKKLFGEADLQLKAYREHEGAVFIESPAFKACREKLEMGVVTIIGDSGDGKTTIAKELLLRQTKRQAVIIADEDDWKKVHLAQDENLIILFDDMLGKFVSDSKKYWKTKLDKIFDAVRSGKIQVVITCRETVLSQCREDIEHFELFKQENRVHLSGPNNTSNLDTDTKRKMIQKHINLMSNISICDELDDENLSGDGRKISLKTLEQIALKNCPGFPQCCYTFVSMPSCFTRGEHFFDNPTECLIKEINLMRKSRDDIDKFNYCTLVCVLFYEELTDDTIEKQLKTIKVIAESCRINASARLDAEIRLATARLSTSYLVKTRDTGYTFQHNSLLQAIFTSFFESHPKLLIEHCAFNLIQSLVTTEQATEKSDLFCKIQGGTQTDCLCSRLATEIMSSNVIEAVGHRALTDPVFVSKFFSCINTSSNKKTVLQSTQDNKSILYLAARVSDTCFVEKLLTEMKSVMFVFRKARMGKKMSRALCGACLYGNYGVFTLLMSRPGVKVSDDCLCDAARGGHDRIVTDLLSVRKWSTHDVTQALYYACSGRYDVYRSLITHNVTAIDDGCLCKAASGGDDRIVTDLLSIRKWSTHDVTLALYEACSEGRYDMYRSLITHNVTAIDVGCLCGAASGGHDRIVTDLLSIRKWSTHDVTQALYTACSKGRYDMYRSLITHNVTAIDDDCLWRAAYGGDDRIVTDLLSVRKCSTHDITQALYKACSEGRYDVYRLLITHNVTAIDGDCLWRAARGGDDRIVTDLLSVRKWSTHDVTQALYGACSKGRYDVYRLLITHNVTAIDDGCLLRAASGGDDRIVTDLLSVRKWSTHDVTQALYEACYWGRYDVYSSLITHNVTVIDGDCLRGAAIGGDDRIVTDLLSVRKWSTHDVTQALYKACSEGRYDVYRLLITHNVTTIDGDCLRGAAIGGHDRIVTDLLSVRKWSTHDVTQALYEACYWGRYDVYSSLITHNVTAMTDGCLSFAAYGGNTKIKDDLLSKGYKLPF